MLAALLGGLPSFLSGLAHADVGPAATCPPTVQLAGEPALTTPIAQALRQRGVVAVPTPGCPLSVVRISRRGGSLVVTLHQEVAESERTVSDPEVAATLIDSWLHSDIIDPLLLVPVLPTLPPPLVPPPTPAPVPPARAGFMLSVQFETSVDKDAATWLGGSLHGCAPVWRVCLGAVFRTAADVPAGRVGEFVDQRVTVDVLASVSFPIRKGRLTLDPGLGFGAGWLRHLAQNAEGGHDDADPTTTMVSNDGGLRAEVRLGARLRLRAGWSVVAGLALDGAFLDAATAQLSTGVQLPAIPWLTLRGGLGLGWSAP